jgi:hypothetical protein
MTTRTGWISALFVSLALAAPGAAPPKVVEITLPEDTARLVESPLSGYALATTFCYTCHSTDYIRYQPAMTRAAWKASVTKMQKTFGAVIPDSAVDPIAEYLAKTYGAERAEATPGGGAAGAKPARGE